MSANHFFLAKSGHVKAFYPLFVKTIKELFPDYTDNTKNYFIEDNYSQKWMESAIDKGDRILFLAQSHDQFVGYLLVSKVYGGVSSASWIAVLPDHQKQGIATKLLAMWEEFCLEQGGHSLQLWTTTKNVKFYEKHDFTKVGLFKNAWFGVSMNLFYKNLREPEEINYLHTYPK